MIELNKFEDFPFLGATIAWDISFSRAFKVLINVVNYLCSRSLQMMETKKANLFTDWLGSGFLSIWKHV